MIRRISEGAIVWVLLAVMGVGVFLPHPENQENRQWARFPEWGGRWEPERLAREMNAYVADHFGGRQWLTGLASLIDLAGGYAAGNQIVVGRGGWLFAYFPTAGDRGRYEVPMPADEHRWWKHYMETEQRELSRVGVHFYTVVAPNKAIIYTYLLPVPIAAYTQTPRYAQLSELLSGLTPNPIIDVHEALWKAANIEKRAVYWKYDTHWNDEGTRLVYEQIMHRLHDDLGGYAPIRQSDCQKTERVANHGNLAGLLGLYGVLRETYVHYECPVTELRERRGSLVILGDSFMTTTKLDGWLGGHFSQVTVIKNPFALVPVGVEGWPGPVVIIREFVDDRLGAVPGK